MNPSVRTLVEQMVAGWGLWKSDLLFPFRPEAFRGPYGPGAGLS